MRRLPRDAKLRLVRRQRRVAVDLDPDSEPIRGVVFDDAVARSFTGWMQLVTALQAAIDRRVDHTETRKPETRIGESP